MIVLQQAVAGLTLGAAYAVAGVTFGLLYRIMKVFHFAFAAIGVCGAFLAVGIAQQLSGWVGVLLGILVGMVFAGIFTAVVQLGVYRPLIRRGASTGTTFVSSLAIGLVLEAILVLIAGPANVQFNLGTFAQTRSFLGLPLSGLLALALMFAILVPAIAKGYLRGTRPGRQTEALISSIEQAELVGIRTRLIAGLACFGAGALSELAFAVQGMNSSVSISGGVPLSLFGVIAMLCGGIDSVVGTAVAGLLIGILSNVAAVTVSSSWATVIIFVIAIIVIVLQPNGVFRKVRST